MMDLTNGAPKLHRIVSALLCVGLRGVCIFRVNVSFIHCLLVSCTLDFKYLSCSVLFVKNHSVSVLSSKFVFSLLVIHQ